MATLQENGFKISNKPAENNLVGQIPFRHTVVVLAVYVLCAYRPPCQAVAFPQIDSLERARHFSIEDPNKILALFNYYYHAFFHPDGWF